MQIIKKPNNVTKDGEMIACGECGAFIHAGDSFCAKCGTKIDWT